MPIGGELQRLREQKGLSQSALAEAAGLSLRSIQNWEQGHREPNASALLALSRVLGVPVESLIRALSAEAQPPAEPPPAKKTAGKRKEK